MYNKPFYKHYFICFRVFSTYLEFDIYYVIYYNINVISLGVYNIQKIKRWGCVDKYNTLRFFYYIDKIFFKAIISWLLIYLSQYLYVFAKLISLTPDNFLISQEYILLVSFS